MIVEKHFCQGKKKLFLLFWNCHRLFNSFHIELVSFKIETENTLFCNTNQTFETDIE